MTKILQINNDKILIGMNDGSVIEAAPNDFNFEIKEFMAIDVYKRNDKYIFTKTNNQKLEHTLTEPRPVNKYIYGLLCMFLGTFGVHYFYANKPLQGWVCRGISIILFLIPIVSFLIIILDIVGAVVQYRDPHMDAYGYAMKISVQTFICYYIIMFISGIVILCKKADKNGNIVF